MLRRDFTRRDLWGFPSNEKRHDCKGGKSQEVGSTRNQITGSEIFAQRQPPNPEDEGELDQKHESKRDTSECESPAAVDWKPQFCHYPAGGEDGHAEHDGLFDQLRGPGTQYRNDPERPDRAQNKTHGEDDQEIKRARLGDLFRGCSAPAPDYDQLAKDEERAENDFVVRG